MPAPTREGTNSLRSSANSSVSDSARAPAMSIAASDIIVTGTSKHDLAALTQLAGDGEDALLRVLHLAHSHRAGRLKFVLHGLGRALRHARSEEHTSELQSLMRISYAVFCLK